MSGQKKPPLKPLRSSFGSANSLGRIIKNPKYSDVKGKTKTGVHQKNVVKKVDRSAELFKRIGRSTLAELIHVHSASQESVYEMNPSDVLSVTTVGDEDERKLQESLVDTDFLILDTRDPDEYQQCHIEGALNFPAICLRRDQYPSQIYKFKSKPGTVVVLYENEEQKAGIAAATVMTEKGFDNIYLLTGGLKYFAKKFPNWLFGNPPKEWAIKKAPLGSGSPVSGQGRMSPRQNMMRKTLGSPGSTNSSFGSPQFRR
mmetsp:Transcript_202/g.448  ORF Transcript_202/g.448 Transcript_202/m.448 type:complete len:258 (+) Transcript_202:26-799(+)|eukprot:CAMPEP_0175140024 /NCGR_PEP_ID=MMETSP0087-20121206/11236_1 /TAXON_ID=136419 /ORGANISM="Unknown Unknown, Strain D1" /LENGTH=257 /DNA_ID=CAMNT_0016423115 /DNA_START=24 /DNA_END=797 /DNA_ORIENTATION=+